MGNCNKKKAPEYVYKDKPVKDEKALIKLLERDGWLEVWHNVTVYWHCDWLKEAMESAFYWDLCEVCEILKELLEVLDEVSLQDFESEHGFRSFDYKDYEYAEIGDKIYKWSGVRKQLEKRGVIKTLPHQNVYCAVDADGKHCFSEYRYLDSYDPLEELRLDGVYDSFEYWLENVSDEEYAKLDAKYDF